MKKQFFEIPEVDNQFKQSLRLEVVKTFEKSSQPFLRFHVLLPVLTSISLVLVMTLRLQQNPTDSVTEINPKTRRFAELSTNLERIDHLIETDATLDTILIQ